MQALTTAPPPLPHTLHRYNKSKLGPNQGHRSHGGGTRVAVVEYIYTAGQ